LNHAGKDPKAMKLQYCVKFAMAAFFTMALSPALVSPVFSATAGNEALIEAARREGELVYYASMNLGEANAIIGEFEKRYPFIKVKLNRTGSEKLLAKVMTEYRAKKTSCRRHSNGGIQHAPYQPRWRAVPIYSPGQSAIPERVQRGWVLDHNLLQSVRHRVQQQACAPANGSEKI